MRSPATLLTPARLRIGTHNANGLRNSRADAAGRLWKQLGLDVILVQETHLTSATQGRADDALRALGYQALWGHYGGGSAGVGVVARLRLLESGELHLEEAQHLVPGRLLQVPARWAGHQLQLASIYLPSGAGAGQRAMIRTQLSALAASGGGEPLWGGDFNFVPDPELDRLCPAGSIPPRRGDEDATAATWREALPHMQDVFRLRHPRRRAYTFVSRRCASRLDRLYAQAALGEHVLGCQVARHILGPRLRPPAPAAQLDRGPVSPLRSSPEAPPACGPARQLPSSPAARFGLAAHPGPARPRQPSSASRARLAVSDHRPVQLDLLGCKPPTTGPGLRRLRLDFLASPTHAEAVQWWVQAQATAAPPSQEGLLAWWPGFKEALVARCRAEQRRFRAGTEPGAVAAARHALEDLYAKLDDGEDVPMAAVCMAQEAWASAAAQGAAARLQVARQAWVHSGERPSPALTRILAPPKRARLVGGLRDSNGRLIVEQPALAGLVARTWASVSAQPHAHPDGVAAVLEALSSSPRLPEGDAEVLGCPVVLLEQVTRALKTTPAGRSPGLDGIPSLLYRRLGKPLHALLARLFSAIGALQRTPRGFLDGAISIMHKHGDRADTANYRPITLLNTDYRLLAKVLANRLQPLLPTVIDRSQLAFVRGRLIGEAVLLMQALPAWLQLTGNSAVAVLCDFAKAFDTVDRTFLLAVLHELGMGAGFVAWVSTLLRHTRACAVVNGFRSNFELFHAGVRQGCPLAPLLYLFVGQAMLQWWRASGVGIPGPPGHPTLVGIQFADDANAFLPGLGDIPRFLSCMAVFAAASNQHLQHRKVQALLLGAPQHRAPGAPAAPTQAHGLAVVTSATMLGIPVGATAAPAVAEEWDKIFAGLWPAFDRIARARLSIFGRGFATAAYGTSTMLYRAEHCDALPQRHLARLATTTARLVERGQSPMDHSRRFAGIHHTFLPDSPASGGFGTLPWKEHIAARHAAWAARLATAVLLGDSPPWASVLGALMRGNHASPHFHPLWLFTGPRGQGTDPGDGPSPSPIGRLRTAARTLPPLIDIGPGDLAPGAWCHAAPLWGNPLLTRQGNGLEHSFPSLTQVPTLATVGDLVRLASGEATPHGHAHRPRLRTDSHLSSQLLALRDAVPPGWIRAAAAMPAAVALPAGSPSDAFWTAVLPRLGWRIGAAAPMTLQQFKVKGATQLLRGGEGGSQSQRTAKLTIFATLAGAPASGDAVVLILRRLWHSPLPGGVKEVFWRLAYDGLPTGARMRQEQGCPCGAEEADRAHHYWNCMAAQGVRDAITSAAAEVGTSFPHLCRAHVWLAQCPDGLHPGVWDIVSMVALAAMDRARRYMVAQTRFAHPPVPRGAELGRQGAERARASFWELLHEFAASGCMPRGTNAPVPLGTTHPFLCSPTRGALRVHVPPTG